MPPSGASWLSSSSRRANGGAKLLFSSVFLAVGCAALRKESVSAENSLNWPWEARGEASEEHSMDTAQLPTDEDESEASYILQRVPVKYPFMCDGAEYVGPIEEISSSGTTAVTMKVHRASDGNAVLAKLSREKEEDMDAWGRGSFLHECAIMQNLTARNVPNTLSCEAHCLHFGRSMIIVSPIWEDSSEAVGRSLNSTLTNEYILGHSANMIFDTVWGMLSADIVNVDQFGNLLLKQDGTPLFIDMGLARNVKHECKEEYLDCDSGLGCLADMSTGRDDAENIRAFLCGVVHFLHNMFKVLPEAWWGVTDGRAKKLAMEGIRRNTGYSKYICRALRLELLERTSEHMDEDCGMELPL